MRGIRRHLEHLDVKDRTTYASEGPSTRLYWTIADPRSKYQVSLSDAPSNIREAIRRDDWPDWKESNLSEMNTLQDNGTIEPRQLWTRRLSTGFLRL